MTPTDRPDSERADEAQFIADQAAFETVYRRCYSHDVSPRDIAFDVWCAARAAAPQAQPNKPKFWVGTDSTGCMVISADDDPRTDPGYEWTPCVEWHAAPERADDRVRPHERPAMTDERTAFEAWRASLDYGLYGAEIDIAWAAYQAGRAAQPAVALPELPPLPIHPNEATGDEWDDEEEAAMRAYARAYGLECARSREGEA